MNSLYKTFTREVGQACLVAEDQDLPFSLLSWALGDEGEL